MIKFKQSLVRVKCLECRTEHHIDMKYINTEKDQRSIGFEYEHTYKGNLQCSNCEQKMSILTLIYEYPKGVINHIESKNEACLVMDNIVEDSLDII